MSEIGSWLASHGLEQHEELFVENDVDLDVVSDLTEEDLASLGLTLGQRKKIMRAIRALAEAGPAPPPAPSAPPAPEPPSPAAPVQPSGGAERRHLTVMFCDLVGSTQLADRLDPEDLRDILKRYHEACRTQISAFGGQIANYLGDGVLAYFGHPEAHEDDAERAVYAGFGIVDETATHPVKSGPGLQVRVGLASGPVVIEEMMESGRWAEDSGAGRTLNLAARIQSVAKAGEVAIDSSTKRLLKNAFTVRSVGEQTLKGFEDAVPVWGIERAVEIRSRFEAAHENTLVPLVGRKEELAILVSRWRRVQDGAGQAVLISAEAGIGKSRLLHELRKETAGAEFALGQCLSYGRSTPYLPLTDLVKKFVGIRDRDTLCEKQEAVARSMSDLGIEAEHRPFIANLLDVSDPDDDLHRLSGEVIQARTFRALAELLTRLSDARPLVIAIEDTHWMDSTSEAFLAALVDRIEHTGIFLVTTHRPEYQAPWLGLARVTQVTLSTLSKDESMTLMQHIIGDQASNRQIAAQVAEKAQGNALFIEELSRAVTSEGSDAGVPDTVHGVLMSRIDRLPKVARHALQTAAVLGREFRLGVLEALWQHNENLHNLIGELQHLKLLYRRIEEEERVLGFRHALIQDAAYESLLISRRRQLHLEAARAIEQLFPDDLDEMAAVLAHHYTRAEVPDPAIRYLLTLSDRALKAYALNEAEATLSEALELVDRLPEEADGTRLRLDIKLRLSQVFYLFGRFDESIGLMVDERETLERGAPASKTAPCLFWLGHMLVRHARYEEAEAAARSAIKQASVVEDKSTLGRAHGVLSIIKCMIGDAEAADEAGRRSIELLRETGELYWLGMSEFYQGMVEITVGNFGPAVEHGSRAFENAERLADNRLKCYAKFLRAWALSSGGDVLAGVAEAEEAVQLAPDPTSRAYAAGFRAYSYLRADDPRALQALEDSQKEIATIGFRPFEGLFLAYLAEAQTGAGLTELALSTAELGIEAARRFNYPLGEGWARRAWAHAAAAEGRLADADAAAEEAKRVFTRIGARFEADRTSARSLA